MTKEEKDLLLKDLCARLPYNVKVQIKNEIVILDSICNDDSYHFNFIGNDKEGVSIEDVKLYLFPLSSMTEEQHDEWCNLIKEPLNEILTRKESDEKMSTLELQSLLAKSITDSVNYCYKNNFDINNLIPKNLAIDATNLNIY